MLARILLACMPAYARKKQLAELYRMTAEAFETEPKDPGAYYERLRHISFDKCLEDYARFTSQMAENIDISGPPMEETQRRLHESSSVYGAALRKRLRIRNMDQAVEALRSIYNMIGISFNCDRRGRFEIDRCFFSGYYSAETCKLISALDEGLAAGLSCGGKLSFEQRITEGGYCCRGTLDARANAGAATVHDRKEDSGRDLI